MSRKNHCAGKIGPDLNHSISQSSIVTRRSSSLSSKVTVDNLGHPELLTADDVNRSQGIRRGRGDKSSLANKCRDNKNGNKKSNAPPPPSFSMMFQYLKGQPSFTRLTDEYCASLLGNIANTPEIELVTSLKDGVQSNTFQLIEYYPTKQRASFIKPATPALVITYPSDKVKKKYLAAISAAKKCQNSKTSRLGLRFGGRSTQINGVRVSYGQDIQKGLQARKYEILTDTSNSVEEIQSPVEGPLEPSFAEFAALQFIGVVHNRSTPEWLVKEEEHEEGVEEEEEEEKDPFSACFSSIPSFHHLKHKNNGQRTKHSNFPPSQHRMPPSTRLSDVPLSIVSSSSFQDPKKEDAIMQRSLARVVTSDEDNDKVESASADRHYHSVNVMEYEANPFSFDITTTAQSSSSTAAIISSSSSTSEEEEDDEFSFIGCDDATSNDSMTDEASFLSEFDFAPSSEELIGGATAFSSGSSKVPSLASPTMKMHDTHMIKEVVKQAISSVSYLTKMKMIKALIKECEAEEDIPKTDATVGSNNKNAVFHEKFDMLHEREDLSPEDAQSKPKKHKKGTSSVAPSEEEESTGLTTADIRWYGSSYPVPPRMILMMAPLEQHSSIPSINEDELLTSELISFV